MIRRFLARFRRQPDFLEAVERMPVRTDCVNVAAGYVHGVWDYREGRAETVPGSDQEYWDAYLRGYFNALKEAEAD